MPPFFNYFIDIRLGGKKDHTPVLTNSNEWTREPFFPKTCSLKEAKASLDFRHIDSYNWANPETVDIVARVVVVVAVGVGAEVAVCVHNPHAAGPRVISGPKPERCVA